MHTGSLYGDSHIIEGFLEDTAGVFLGIVPCSPIKSIELICIAVFISTCFLKGVQHRCDPMLYCLVQCAELSACMTRDNR